MVVEASPSTASELVPVELGAGAFLRGWKISDPSICDNLMSLFLKRQQSGSTLMGQVSMKGGGEPVINKDVKDSEEISFHPKSDSPEFRNYMR